jgi:3',5'-cyclic AMP phosphodiesterase CpdA
MKDEPAAVRLAHFSDVHVTVRKCAWRRADWFNKRLSAWINLRCLGRGYRFRDTEVVMEALRDDLNQRGFDRAIFSGDATALGFEEEVARAVELLGLGKNGAPPGLAVPGNHDYCTAVDAVAGHFERHFGPWQGGERVSGALYPFAQRVGPAWLVAVNSATANRWAWDASGAIGAEQLRRLDELLARLDGGPRILVTHYPVYLSNGKPESRAHRLRDLDDLLAVARRGGINLWLHGHRHDFYSHGVTDRAPFPILCAGSATQHGKWSYGDYTLRGRHLHVVRRVFEEKAGRFRDGETFDVELAGPIQ